MYVGGAQAVLGRVPAAHNALRIAGYEEKRDSVGIETRPRRARADDELVGRITVVDDYFFPFERPAVSVGAGNRGNVRDLISGMPLGVRKGQSQASVDNLRHQSPALAALPARRNRPPASTTAAR